MMKLMICILISLSSATLFGQDVKSRGNQTKSKSKIQIGINYSPDYCYRTLITKDSTKFTNLYLNNRDYWEIPAYGFTSGINMRYAMNKMVAFEAGLQISNNRYQTQEMHYDNLSTSIGELNSLMDIYEHYYAEIPLKVDFSFGSGKFRFNGGTGVTISYLLKEIDTYVFTFEDDNVIKKEVIQSQGINTFNFSSTVSLGFTYKATQRSTFSLLPTFRYGLLSLIDSPIKEHLWSAGLNLGYYYQL